jgi:tetratricopeptide (TPR) repeat protein
MERWDDAFRCFTTAVTLNPDFPEARLGLARRLERKGDLAGAKKELEKVLQLRPNDAAARASLEQIRAFTPNRGNPNGTPP